MLERDRPFPDWESLYRSQNVESMPWYNESLDSDLESELNGDKIVKGSFLDLGTGLGTHFNYVKGDLKLPELIFLPLPFKRLLFVLTAQLEIK